MAVLRNLFAPERRVFSGPWGPYGDGRIPPPGWEGGISTAGIAVTPDTAMTLIDAYACIALLEDSVSMLPLDQYRRDGNRRVPIDPTPQIIMQADPEIDQWQWVARLVGSLATRGNAYAYLYDRDRRGYPQHATVIHPDDVRVRRNRQTGKLQYDIRSSTLGNETLPTSEILHIPLIVMGDHPAGLSPIECARRGLGLAIATEDFGARWFGDGATPSSALETDENLDEDQTNDIQARWIASHGGKRRPAVLSGGLKWRPVQIAPNESQFLETRRLNTSQVARIWRIPPQMIGDLTEHASQGGGKGMEELGIGFVVYTLGAYLFRIESALSSPKMSPRGQYTKFNVDALLRGNSRDRFTNYAIARQWGWMSVNDIRALEELPPIYGGETYLQPLNMIDAQDALRVLLSNNGGGA